VAGVLDGVKVIEVAGWTFVPAGGGVLADWGADVIKIEHPETGDPQRGLSIGAISAKGPGGVSFSIEQPNRGKRSLGLNIATQEGRDLLLKLVAKADVFLTNLLPDRLERLRLTVEDLRAANPEIIVARGTGQGVRGEDANKAGFDGSSYFSRGGIAHMLMEQNMQWPPMQRPAFGDILGGFALASGIAGALFKRERTGEPSVVDVSLLGMATWHLSPDLVATGLLGEDNLSRFTADGKARFVNRVECISILREAFAAKPLKEWREKMAALEGAWAVVQTPAEVLEDPQVRENGYIRTVTGKDGETTYDLVANPVQFDETPPDLTRAPDSGEHTDEILDKELGLDWDAVLSLKLNNTVN
jgi:crotonobetainyl-CoA:carnitine CoA-transferase CaiB-like acyl-CoA transferase